MARTYGEILPESFGAVFEPCTTGKTVFVDIGSGHGLITVAAVQDYGCSFAIGIEKYRDRQDTCDATVAGLPAELKAKLKFVLEDIGDVDLQQLLSSVDFEGLIIFSNDLAFNQGLIKRMAAQVRRVCDANKDKPIYFFSTLPIESMSDLANETVGVRMSWTTDICDLSLYMNDSAATCSQTHG